jgi:hypothetical protein
MPSKNMLIGGIVKIYPGLEAMLASTGIAAVCGGYPV